MKTYGVCIGSYVSEGNFAFVACANKTEARQNANKYRRAWGIDEPILKIVEIPATILDGGDEAKIRAYAANAAK